MAAARAVFAVRGLDAPLDEIARRAGVSIGTLYDRFPTRVDLVDAALAERVLTSVRLAERRPPIRTRGAAWRRTSPPSPSCRPSTAASPTSASTPCPPTR
ncbi:MAG TPA: helix-turn-helix domain-containing protein [Pseudonocardia sp.]|nr:helix-turn-helix domain-containing protein [Pseudonocardia sp.]